MSDYFDLLDRNHTTLVVIDMQEPFLRGIFERDRVVGNVSILVEAAKTLGLPVVATLQYQAKMGDVIPEIDQALPEGERIDKTTFSCCGKKGFVAALEKLGHPGVILCGVEAHICVNQTVLDLLRLSYQVYVVADAVSSRKESNYRIGLERMSQAGAVIISTEMAVFELLRDAAAPEFKKILELVK